MTINVAIVDDDESILDAIKMVLEGQGWRVRTYASGEAFLGDIENHRPDCIVLDPHLPGLSGADVVRTLRNGEMRAAPVIGLTARPASALAVEVLAAGARVMLTKPVTADELIDHLDVALSRR